MPIYTAQCQLKLFKQLAENHEPVFLKLYIEYCDDAERELQKLKRFYTSVVRNKASASRMNLNIKWLQTIAGILNQSDETYFFFS